MVVHGGIMVIKCGGGCPVKGGDGDGVSRWSRRWRLRFKGRHRCDSRKNSIDNIEIREYGEGLGVKGKIGWVKNICSSEHPDVIVLQETRCRGLDDRKSGGLLIVWDTRCFSVTSTVGNEFFIAIKGCWIGSDQESTIVNIYDPHNDAGKKLMWDSLDKLLVDKESAWLLCEDFNEVRDCSDRLNSVFHHRRASRFNEFIAIYNLIEIPINGRKFTRISDDGTKFMFSVWFNNEGVVEVIKDSWVKSIRSSRRDCMFRDRLKNVKFALKDWSHKEFDNLDCEINKLKEMALELEKKAERGCFNESERLRWLDARRSWLEKESVKANMLKQKARFRWIREDDENSKFFHNSIRRRYNKCNIRGLNINGSWNDDPSIVKTSIFCHFRQLFARKNQ
ncbi:uncharacterized protein [Rutidosis leptorrhynchoides]|uniref:uncharacterized protein n=1 Tax=Rutidosis leptorrhynchoides TaxID=125765 RepID=UPI003A9989D6